MSNPFIAEVKIFAGNFAPRGWAFCNGQLLPIAQNPALFSLMGTTYGGDGRTTTALPNLQGRAPMHPGNGPGLTSRRLGQVGGTETTILTEAQMPNHTHRGTSGLGDGEDNDPQSQYLSSSGMYAATGSNTPMASEALLNTGGGQLHNNLQPFLSMHFIIALTGLYPSRS